MERTAERRRAAHQLANAGPRGGGVQVKYDRRLAAWPGRDAERHLDDDAEPTHRARHQAEGVEAGDVLEHLAAEPQRLASAVEDRGAEHAVAHRAGERTARAGEPR